MSIKNDLYLLRKEINDIDAENIFDKTNKLIKIILKETNYLRLDVFFIEVYLDTAYSFINYIIYLMDIFGYNLSNVYEYDKSFKFIFKRKKSFYNYIKKKILIKELNINKKINSIKERINNND